MIKVAVAISFLAALGFIWFTGATSVPHLANDIVATYLMVWGLYAMISNVSRLEIRTRFFLMTVALVFLLVLLEAPAWLGFIDYRNLFPLYSQVDWKHPGNVLDDELLVKHQPYLRLKGKYTKGNIAESLCLPPQPEKKYKEYDVQYDWNGFRNVHDLATANIAVIGDSYIEAPMLSSSVLFPTVLGQLQKKPVSNLGMSGYGPVQELVVLKRYALKLDPEIIVWVFYEGNDLSDVDQYEKKKETLPEVRKFHERRLLRSFTRNALHALLHARDKCVPNPQVEKFYGTLIDSEGRKWKIHFLHPDNHLTPAVREHEALLKTITGSSLSPRELDALSRTGSILATAYELCRKLGIRFVVVFAPDSYRVYHSLPNLIEVSEEFKQWKMNDLPERLERIVRNISPDIDYIDLTQPFKEETKKGTFMFLTDDTHWTAEGHRIVAEVVNKVISRHSLPQEASLDLRMD